MAVVELVPASWRPYIGGSQTNSVWELIWGYNGLGRLTGDETGSVGGGGGWGETGIGRLFTADIGGQVAWLLPAALCCSASPGWSPSAARRAPTRAGRRCCCGAAGWWSPALVFSLMAGIFHAYYTVALAPAIAALVGIGGRLLWQRRGRVWARLVLAATLAGTVAWAWVLLARSSDYYPWLKWLVLVVGLLAAVGLLVVDRVGRAVAATLVAVGLLAALGAPAAYAVDTAGTAHTGSIPSAGPAVTGGRASARPVAAGSRRPGGMPPFGARRRHGAPAARTASPAARCRACPAPRPAGRPAGPGRPQVGRRRHRRPARRRRGERGRSPRRSPRTRRPTPGWPRPSAPTAPPATSWPPSCR